MKFVPIVMWHTFICVAYAVQCPYPGIPKNGYVVRRSSQSHTSTEPLQVGETIHFNCYWMWELVFGDDEYVQCLDDGSLKGSVPRCLEKVTSFSWQSEFFLDHNSTRQIDSSEKFPCEESFTEIRIKPKYDHLHISDVIEVWVNICPQSTSEGTVRVTLNDFHTCSLIDDNRHTKKFKCFDFVDKQGDISLKSISLAIDHLPVPISSAAIWKRPDDLCGAPPVPVNGGIHVAATGAHQYHCEKNFTINGNDVADCDPAVGKWTPVPKCEHSNCGDPPAPINSQVEFVSPGKFRFNCSENFSLRGNDTVECDSLTGLWSSMPICEPDVVPDRIIYLSVSAAVFILVAIVLSFRPWKRRSKVNEAQVVYVNTKKYVYWQSTDPAAVPTPLRPELLI